MLNSLNSCQRKSNDKRINSIKIIFMCLATILSGCNQSKETQPLDNEQTETKIVESGATFQTDLPAHFPIGNAVTKEVIAGWDIEVRPDGLGLPEGSGSVEDGEELYEEKCSVCHGSFGEGEDQWPKLTGGKGSLVEDRPEKTVGSFWPYASTLWDYINRAMPFPAPQSLKPDEVYAITAYVLNLNDIVDDEFVLSKENFATVQMPNKDGFYVDDRPDTNNRRCMQDCKDPSGIKVVLGPKYSLGQAPAENTDVPQDSSRASGEQQVVDTYESVCKVCHATGIANAPRLSNQEDWAERVKQGKAAIYMNALNGLNGMPAKGGRSDLSDDSVKAIVDYMLDTLE